jgi:hypothetical protein
MNNKTSVWTLIFIIHTFCSYHFQLHVLTRYQPLHEEDKEKIEFKVHREEVNVDRGKAKAKNSKAKNSKGKHSAMDAVEKAY